jgi:hypothetical protein
MSRMTCSGCFYKVNDNSIKGTVARDFPLPFFSSKVPTLDPDSYPSFFFQIWFRIRGVITTDVSCCGESNLSTALCSGESSLAAACCSGESNLPTAFCMTPCCILHWRVRYYRCKMQRGVKSYHCIMQRAGSRILPPHDAAGSQFGSGESSIKTLEDSLGP